MKKLLFAMFLMPSLALSYDKSGFALLGVGSEPCEMFVLHMEKLTQAATAIYTQWQGGFISGVNSVMPGSQDFSHAVDREQLLNKTLKFCRNNPNKSFYDATQAVLFESTQESIYKNNGRVQNKSQPFDFDRQNRERLD